MGRRFTTQAAAYSLAFFALAAGAPAQETREGTAQPAFQERSLSLGRAEAAAPKETMDPLFENDPFDFIFKPIADLKSNLKDNHQLDFYDVSYTILYQHANHAPSGDNSLLSGRFDLGANWELLDWGGESGSIGFLMRWGTNFSHNQDYSLNSRVGSIQNISFLGGAQQQATLNLLYWRQTFMDQKLAVYVGKLHPNQHVDLSTVANDERTQFLAGPFDGNPTNPQIAAYAPGLAFEYKMDNDFYLHGIMTDALARADTGLSTLHRGRFYKAVELGYKPMGPDNTPTASNYRAYVWHEDTSAGNGMGVGLGFDHEMQGGWVPFARWGYANPDVAPVEHTVAVGLTNIRPFGREGDMFGIAGTWANPSDDSLREEKLFEIFYRIQVTENMELSPDLQFVVDPSLNPSEDLVTIVGLRLKVLF